MLIDIFDLYKECNSCNAAAAVTIPDTLEEQWVHTPPSATTR